MSEIDESLNYLREVLGVRYLPIRTSSGHISPVKAVPSSAVSNSLGAIEATLQGCTRCKLHTGRRNIVFGSGSPQAQIVFVGEGPGEQEDIQGLPFVGPAGQLLTKMIEAMGLTRDQVYIANVVKCRPPFNRNPEPDEIQTCSPFLLAQLETINPQLIIALGTFAAQTLLRTQERISRLRGTVHDFKGKKLIATFHPSYLLRNPAEKKSAWADLQLAMKFLGLKSRN